MKTLEIIFGLIFMVFCSFVGLLYSYYYKKIKNREFKATKKWFSYLYWLDLIIIVVTVLTIAGLYICYLSVYSPSDKISNIVFWLTFLYAIILSASYAVVDIRLRKLAKEKYSQSKFSEHQKYSFCFKGILHAIVLALFTAWLIRLFIN